MAELGGWNYDHDHLEMRVFASVIRLVSFESSSLGVCGVLISSFRPMACLAWLLAAMVCLVVFKESIKVTYSEDKKGEKRRLVDPFLSRYYAPRRRTEQPAHQDVKDDTNEALEMLSSPTTSSNNPVDRTRAEVKEDPNAVNARSIMKITIRMKNNRGLQSWQGYEALLETLAVGIYLYATFVLTSALFFTGEEAITYASVMILCLTVIRLIGI